MKNLLIQDAFLGPAVPALGWVPAPRYLLRRSRINHALRGIQPCRLLEIGCGPGMLLRELTSRGFECSALETSDQARAAAIRISESLGDDGIRFHSTPDDAWTGQFPLIMAFEVLEHIEDDAGALAEWASWLAPGGHLILSVPAHQKRWNARDVWAGHVKRYERAQLRAVVEGAGLEVESIECYGFPLANALEILGEGRYQVDPRVAEAPASVESRDDNTANSGVDRSSDAKWFPLLKSWPGKAALMAALVAQRPFLGTEMGNGYLLKASKCR